MDGAIAPAPASAAAACASAAGTEPSTAGEDPSGVSTVPTMRRSPSEVRAAIRSNLEDVSPKRPPASETIVEGMSIRDTVGRQGASGSPDVRRRSSPRTIRSARPEPTARSIS